jgi:hypothetical protein
MTPSDEDLRRLLEDWNKTTTNVHVWMAARGSSVVGERADFMVDLLNRTRSAILALENRIAR